MSLLMRKGVGDGRGEGDGVGVGVWASAFKGRPETVKPATSLRLELGRELERAPLLVSILSELESAYDAWAAAYRG